MPRKKHLPGSSLSLFDRLYDCYVDCLQTSNDKSADKVQLFDFFQFIYFICVWRVNLKLSRSYLCICTYPHAHYLQRFRSAVNLLLRVERAHAKPSLIVSLYEDEKGYSLILCPSEGNAIVQSWQVCTEVVFE